MSRFRLAHEPDASTLTDSPEAYSRRANGSHALRNPWTRLTWVEDKTGARLYAAGQAYDCSIDLAEALVQETSRYQSGSGQPAFTGNPDKR